MINCKVTVEKKPDPAGDRVVLTFECVIQVLFLLRAEAYARMSAGNSCRTASGKLCWWYICIQERSVYYLILYAGDEVAKGLMVSYESWATVQD